MGAQRWLLKTEPATWSWQHQEANGGLSQWDGVRNAQAQKNLRSMAMDDLCFFYHSGKSFKEIVGIVRVCKTFYPDDSSIDRSFDMVDLQAMIKFDRPIPLARLREESGLEGFALFRQPRLSVVPVTSSQWNIILSLSGQSLPSFVAVEDEVDRLSNSKTTSDVIKDEISHPLHTKKKTKSATNLVDEEVSKSKSTAVVVKKECPNFKSGKRNAKLAVLVEDEVCNPKSTISVTKKEIFNLNDGKKKTKKTTDMVMKVDEEISDPCMKTIVKSMVGSVKEEVSNHHGKRKSTDMVKARFSNPRTPKISN